MSATRPQTQTRRPKQQQQEPPEQEPMDELQPKSQTQPQQQQRQPARTPSRIANQNWPAWGYLVSAGIAFGVWLGGTAVQVQTSEDWFSSALGVKPTGTMQPHFSVFNQIALFWNGGLDTQHVPPFMFAWAVQAALVLFSIGVDLPAHTKGHMIRSRLFIASCIGLIITNSLGDWYYSEAFGHWAQLGFVLALFVSTFCFGYIVIHQTHCAIRAFQGK